MTKKEQIYKDLKKKLLESKIKSYDVLKEEELAAKYKISRTPIREALQLLDKEGFLKKVKKVGYMLCPLSKKDLNEIIGIRSILESYAAYLATINYEKSVIDKLNKINEKAYQTILNNDFESFFKINSDFHETIYNASGNQRLILLIKNLNENFIRYRVMLLKVKKMPEISYNDHLEMIDAMESRNADKVEKLVKEHIIKGGKILIDHINSSDIEIFG